MPEQKKRTDSTPGKIHQKIKKGTYTRKKFTRKQEMTYMKILTIDLPFRIPFAFQTYPSDSPLM